MQHIRRLQIIAAFVLLAIPCTLKAQERNPLYDLKKYHFGFSLIGNSASLKYSTAPNFLDMDTLNSIHSKNFTGFGLGMIGNMRMGDNMDLRILPAINFCQRNLIYDYKGGKSQNIKIESTYLDLPLLVKLKSDRLRNVRFYVIGGIKYSYDLQSKKKKIRNPNDPIVAMEYNSFSYEVGCGFDLYLEFFKFSPEIKISNNFTNVLVKDQYINSQALSTLYGHLLQFSLHFE